MACPVDDTNLASLLVSVHAPQKAASGESLEHALSMAEVDVVLKSMISDSRPQISVWANFVA